MKISELMEILKTIDGYLDITTVEGDKLLGVYVGLGLNGEVISMIEVE